MHVSDWYSTFSHLAGVDPNDDHEGVPSIDSVNQWPVLSGQIEDKAESEREIFAGSGVLIQGKWKLIATGAGFSAQWTGPMYPKVPATGPKHIKCQEKTPCLFDVVADPSEYHEVSAQNPEVVEAMQARLAVLNKGVFEGVQPKVAKGAVCKATQKNGNFLTPSDYALG